MRRTGVTTPAVGAEVESSANSRRIGTHQKPPRGAAFDGFRSLGMDPKAACLSRDQVLDDQVITVG